MPKEIHPLCKAMDGKTYHASVSNMLPNRVSYAKILIILEID